jgi:hypothetical protein
MRIPFANTLGANKNTTVNLDGSVLTSETLILSQELSNLDAKIFYALVPHYSHGNFSMSRTMTVQVSQILLRYDKRLCSAQDVHRNPSFTLLTCVWAAPLPQLICWSNFVGASGQTLTPKSGKQTQHLCRLF